jgi:hypothetical protein
LNGYQKRNGVNLSTHYQGKLDIMTGFPTEFAVGAWQASDFPEINRLQCMALKIAVERNSCVRQFWQFPRHFSNYYK